MAKEDDNIGGGCGCIFIVIIAISALVSEFEMNIWQAIISIALVICIPILLYKTYSKYREKVSNPLRLCFCYSPTILLLELCAEFCYIIFRDNVSFTELFISTIVHSVAIILLFLSCVSWHLSFRYKAICTFIFGTLSSIIISLITSFVVPSYVFITNESMKPKHLHIDKNLSNISSSYWGKTYYVNKSGRPLYIFKSTCTYYKEKYNDNLSDILFLPNAQFEKEMYFPDGFKLYETPPRELSNQRIHYYVIDEGAYKSIQNDKGIKIVKCNHNHKYYYTQRIVHSRFRKYHED